MLCLQACSQLLEPIGLIHAAWTVVFSIFFPEVSKASRSYFGTEGDTMWGHNWCPTVLREYDDMYRGNEPMIAKIEAWEKENRYDVPIVVWARDRTCVRSWTAFGACSTMYASKDRRWRQNGVPVTWVEVQESISNLTTANQVHMHASESPP